MSERPTALPVLADAIPVDLRQRNQWMRWRVEMRGGKPTKVPYQVDGRHRASSDDPSTWGTFAEVLDTHLQNRGGLSDGIGYVFSAEDPYCGIDLDDAINPSTGQLKPWAEAIVSRLKSYTEISPSGTGVKVWVRAKKPGSRCRTKHEDGEVEIYDQERYFATTGHRWPGTPETIEERQAELDTLYAELFPPKAKKDTHSPRVETSVAGDDQKLIEKAKAARNGNKFARLFDGDTSEYDGDDSRADAALCTMLAFWTDRDASRMDRLFRSSGLARPKWDERRGERTYGEITIESACASVGETYRGCHRPSSNGHSANGHKPDQKTQSRSFVVGPLEFRPGAPRQTAAGRISLPVDVRKAGIIVYPFALTNAASSRKEPIRVLKGELGDDLVADQLDAMLTRLLAYAAEILSQRQAPDGPTIRQILADKVPPALQPVCRVDKGLWSEAKGCVITRPEFVTFVPGWLIEECTKATDAPTNLGGQVQRLELIRAVQTEMGVLWAELHSSLPREAEVDLGENTEKGRAFRAAMIRLWKIPITWERQQTANGDTATRASLVSRVLTQKDRKGRDRAGWFLIHPAADAWWREWSTPEGEVQILLAMRYTLPAQVGMELPGVSNEDTLTRLGKQFGVLMRPPDGVPSRLSGGSRLGVLSLSLTRELTEMPCEDPDDNPREPGA